jgi:beta-lactamase superfamily II metal-dependent hydrolase
VPAPRRGQAAGECLGKNLYAIAPAALRRCCARSALAYSQTRVRPIPATPIRTRSLSRARAGTPVLYPRGGTVWHTGDGVTFRFYGPTLPLLVNTRNDINSNSLVFRLEYGRFRMLFTGDAGAEAGARILASGADLHADVLKVGHHGSAYSSTPEFIRAVSPRYAIISVGPQQPVRPSRAVDARNARTRWRVPTEPMKTAPSRFRPTARASPRKRS